MSSKWGVFRKPIVDGEKTVIAITKAVVVLHNFIKRSEQNAGNYFLSIIIFLFVNFYHYIIYIIL